MPKNNYITKPINNPINGYFQFFLLKGVPDI